MNLQIQSEKCIFPKKNKHSFGPTPQAVKISNKRLKRESKSVMEVSFKKNDQVIIVENWKKYNEDVSNLEQPQTPIRKFKESSCTGCSIF
ncbi:unnamed protein product (macronuclear) [Paramecium tetraurelia]|uniref:Uncharacterized protein n=1 Tax=Paramecium tetraurelia TaxID=5888 RepID=A0DEY5_PARTE|nr:uncharacterized protein GSPATT00016428001 [Paramecium tetraurelia]CAK81602.1 unnamed protein product [Paramecium tetraurelia]|eukprot:XP_001448999.1 hypothetical protein (macronuclear) [Paramecium tetraurelia strain d4-2]